VRYASHHFFVAQPKSSVKNHFFDKDKEILCHQLSSTAAASCYPVTQKLSSTFVVVVVVRAWAMAAWDSGWLWQWYSIGSVSGSSGSGGSVIGFGKGKDSGKGKGGDSGGCKGGGDFCGSSGSSGGR
jgi:hypothetical protein